MKKLVLIFLSLAVVAAAAVGTYQYLQKAENRLTDVLPEGPLVFFQLSDVEENLKQLSTMPTWTVIRDLNYDLLQSQGAQSGQAWQVLKTIKDQVLAVATNPVSQKLFGNEVALAIYPAEKDLEAYLTDLQQMNPQVIEEMLSGLFLATRVDKDVQFAEFVARFFSQFGANITRGEVVYKDEKIHTVKANELGLTFGLVRLNDIIILGIGEKAARSAVDVYKKDLPSLSHGASLARLQQQFSGSPALTGMVNIRAFRDLTSKQMEKYLSAGEGAEQQFNRRQWDTLMAQFAGLETFGLSVQVRPAIRFDSQVLYNPRELNKDFAELYTCPAQENKTLQLVPKDVLAYQWTNCFSLDHYWKQFQRETADSPESQARIAAMETETGFSLANDILPVFGDEFGGFLQDIQTGSLFPVPRLLMFVKIRDRAKADRLLARLKEQPFMTLQQENYNGVPIEYLALPLGESISPGYCFFEDYFLVATSHSLLKASIDAARDPSLSLPANDSFKAVDIGLTGKNRSVQFVRVGEIIEKLKGLLQWGDQWVTAQESKTQAFESGSALRLEEAEAALQLKQRQLEKVNEQMAPMDDEIWLMETQGVDTTEKKAVLKGLQDQALTLEAEIVDEQGRRDELVKIVENYKEQAPDPSQRKLIMNEVVFPVLESLKSIKASALRATVEGDSLKSTLILDLQK